MYFFTKNYSILHLFIDEATGQAVKSFDISTIFGDRVYAKGIKYWKKSDAPTPLNASDGSVLSSNVRYKYKTGGLLSRLKRKVA